jgi:hypothetical protein
MRVLTAAWAAFGLVVGGSLAAIITTGLIEGIESIPSALSSAAGVLVFLGAMLLAGKVCEEVAGERAFAAAAVTAIAIGTLGSLAATATEAHGEGLELSTVLYLVAGLATLLGSSVALAGRRHRRRVHPRS